MSLIRRLVGDAVSAVAERAITHVRGRIATGVHVTSISLRFEPTGTGHLIHGRYELATERPEDRRPIAIDCTGECLSPIQLHLGWSGASGSAPTLPVHAFDLPPQQESWSGATVHALFRWEPPGRVQSGGDISPVLVLPDALPRLLEPVGPQSRSVIQQPRITIADPLPTELGVAGLRSPGAVAAESVEYLQAGILARHHWWEDDHANGRRVILTGTATPSLSIADRRRVVDVVDKTMAFLGGRFAHIASADVFVDLEEPVASNSRLFGIRLSAEPGWFGISSAPDEMRIMSIVQPLSSIWLTAGCRVDGPYSAAFVVGVGGALGISLLDAMGKRQMVEDLLRRYQSFTVQGTRQPADAANLVRSIVGGLYACATSRLDSLIPLQQFIVERWGTVVAPEELLAVLRNMGIDLPERLLA